MNTQLELGERLRDAGMAHVLIDKDEYRQRFFAAALERLSEFGTVTSDDVIGLIGMPPGHPSAVGAVMRTFAVEHGLKVLCYRKSTRPSCHAAVIAVWGR